VLVTELQIIRNAYYLFHDRPESGLEKPTVGFRQTVCFRFIDILGFTVQKRPDTKL